MKVDARLNLRDQGIVGIGTHYGSDRKNQLGDVVRKREGHVGRKNKIILSAESKVVFFDKRNREEMDAL